MQDATRTTLDARISGAPSIAAGMSRGRWFGLRRPGGLLACILVVLAAPGLVVQAGDAPVDPVVVRVHPTAVVNGDEVTLADVAEVNGEAGRLAAGWRVISAPQPGESLTLDSSQIQQVLTRRGANISAWLFRGAIRCEIRRPGVARAMFSQTMAGADPTRAADQAVGDDVPQQSNPEITLEDCLRAHLMRQVVSLGGELVVQFSPAASKYLALAKPVYRFVIQQRGDRLLGLVALEVTVYEGESVKQVIPVVAQVSVRKRVVAAARPINRGQTIEARDLQLVGRTFDRLDDIGLADLAPLVGQRAKQFIQESALLTVRDIEPVPLVSRNDLVTVWVRRGGVVIKGVAKAMGSAGYGQTIELKSEMSRQVFVGVVTGPRTVEVPAVRADAPGLAMLAEGGQR